MAAEEAEADIDPGWYPGQLETAADPPADHVPTVLTKLQKWGDYIGCGEPVRPTRFIPMKTPLSRQILGQWSLPQQPKHSLTVPEMLEQQQRLGPAGWKDPSQGAPSGDRVAAGRRAWATHGHRSAAAVPLL